LFSYKNASRKVKAAIVIGAVVAMGGGLAACGQGQNAQQTEQRGATAQQAEYNKTQPIPYFKWSLERQILIDAEISSAQGDQSTSFFFNFGIQDPVMICPSLGMAVPDTSQLSNPMQIVPIPGRWGGGADIMPQADPFGIHTPAASDGTYVICIINGKPSMQRAEETVHTVMAPATWDETTHRIKIVGNPTSDVVTAPPAGVQNGAVK
jgi:hypothetical protein